MSYKGQRDTSSTSLAKQKDTAKSDKGLEDPVASLEEMFRQVLQKLDKAPERRKVIPAEVHHRPGEMDPQCAVFSVMRRGILKGTVRIGSVYHSTCRQSKLKI